MGTHTFTDVTADHTIHATFAIDTYTIAATAGDNGSISPSGAVTVDHGASETFTITPDSHYHVADVVVDNVSVGAVGTYTFTDVTADHTIHATFAIDTYTIAATAGDNGSISPSGAVTVNHEADQTFTITPDSHYQVVDVVVDNVSVGAVSTYTFTNVTADHTIHATFAVVYTIAATAGDVVNGSISPSGAVMVEYGADQTFTITPDSRYHVADVLVDDVSVGAVIEYTFTNITADHTIHAIFERNLIELVSASYEVCEALLTLAFDSPIDPARTRFNRIDMEIGDSGELDFGLGNTEDCLEAVPGPMTSEMRYPVEIDIQCEVPAVASLAIAAFITHRCDDIDLILAAGAFTDQDDVSNAAADVPLQITCEGIEPMVKGDLNDDGVITAYDAGLLLQFSIFGSPALPVYDRIVNVSNWMESFGYPDAEAELTHFLTETDGQLGVTANDAVAILRFSTGLIDTLPDSAECAPGVDVTRRNGRLVANSYDSQKLEVAIDLDDFRDIHSADIVLTYNPQMMEVADVSGTPTVSGWLSTYGTPTPGQLKIALAGLSQPTGDSSLVTVSFDATSADAIKHLDLTELKLNGLKATVQNLPKAFALLQNYPNPFNPETWIPYHLSEPVSVTVTIYSVTGQMVRRLELGNRMPGSYVDRSRAVYWDGRNEWGEKTSSGIYFYQLQAGRDASVRKMTIVE